MFKIGEFSKLTQVSVRMLRHYDKVGLLKPAYTDVHSGYRYYCTEQIGVLNKIIFLRDLGFSISEMASAVSQWEEGNILNLLETKKAGAEEAIQREQNRLAKIQLAQRDIQKEQISVHYNVTVKSVPSCLVLSFRRIIPDYYGEGLLWKEMAAFAERKGIQIGADVFSIYHDTEYKEQDVDVELCAPVYEMGEGAEGFTFRYTEAVEFMACMMVYGPFENIAAAYLSFAGWLSEHNRYKMAGQSRQAVHRGPWNESDAAQYLTEIQIPLLEI